LKILGLEVRSELGLAVQFTPSVLLSPLLPSLGVEGAEVVTLPIRTARFQVVRYNVANGVIAELVLGYQVSYFDVVNGVVEQNAQAVGVTEHLVGGSDGL